MATTTPYGNPNWFKRQNRLNTPREPKRPDLNDPRQAAESLYGAGLQLGMDGVPKPTKDYGSLMRLNSSQMNSLSRGAKPGSFSSLGQPMNSMYANNPSFFNREGGNNFAGSIQQRNQSLTPGAPVMTREQNIARAQQEGTFGTIQNKYNLENQASGTRMNKFGNIQQMTQPQKTPTGMTLDRSLIEKLGFGTPASATSSAAPAPASQSTSPQAANRAGLEERAGGLRLLREMSQTPLQTTRSGGDVSLQGQYGTGSSTQAGPRQGLIGGQSAKDVLGGLANKQVREGTWRSGDRLPEGMNAEQATKENEKSRQGLLSRQRLSAKR